jgi:hypothetical protein
MRVAVAVLLLSSLTGCSSDSGSPGCSNCPEGYGCFCLFSNPPHCRCEERRPDSGRPDVAPIDAAVSD